MSRSEVIIMGEVVERGFTNNIIDVIGRDSFIRRHKSFIDEDIMKKKIFNT